MLTLALAGLGTVGSGVVRLLQNNADLITARVGQSVVIKAVSAQNKNKSRDCDLKGITWVDDPCQLAALPDVDVVVELIGGAEGVARQLGEATLRAGKHLVTANKALLAAHGVELARLAETHKRSIGLEAAVAGGVPVIKTLREGLAGNQVSVVRGILNGTCNYILSRMRDAHLDFAVALKEAQDKGYAEADPAADIDGHDTANKLAILAALAFGSEPDLKNVHVEGIRAVTPLDLAFAEELGCRIKLLGNARLTEEGLEQRVGPSLVAENSPLSKIEGVLNAIMLRGNFTGDLMLAGQGAGAEPTASAVVADIMDRARGLTLNTFGVPLAKLKKYKAVEAANARYYMRLQVMDKPGVVADISAILRDDAISIESLLQRGQSVTQSVPVVVTTHEAASSAIHRAVDKIGRLPTIVEKPCLMKIED